MNVRLRELAAEQADLVAAWQLMAEGASWNWIQHRRQSGGWRRVHSGVYALTQSPLTRRQRWIAATLTTPHSVLSHASAGACWGFRPWEAAFETITRPGSGGPRRLRGLLVCRSSLLSPDTTVHEGIKITTGARVLIDLAPHQSSRAVARSFREAVRLGATTPSELSATLERHPTRRGTLFLSQLATRYAALPYARTRSDAESRALELLHDAGIEPPLTNVKIAGEEADLLWPRQRRIIEIDGPQYHRFPEEDARKQRAWEQAGYTVRRIRSDIVYDEPQRLLALARGLTQKGEL